MSDRSEKNSKAQNNSLNDVEKLLLLLSDLKIMDSEKPENPQNQEQIVTLNTLDINSKNNSRNNKLETSSLSLEVRSASDVEVPNLKRSPPVYPFPSLLDELPFLRDLPSIQANNQANSLEKESIINLEQENSSSSDNAEYLSFNKKDEELETINLIHTLLLGDERSLDSPQLDLTEKSFERSSEEILASSEDDQALHILQDILVSPELEELRSFKISVEQKLGIVEQQVNSPDLQNKIEGLESLIQNASLGLSSLGSQLTKIGNDQDSIPIEIENVRERVAQLEKKLYQPQELVQLLLPIIAEILNLKANQSREEMCQAIMPIIAEVIFERSQLDRVSMSRAIADILPNALSEQIRNSPDEIAKAIAPEMGAAIREQIRLDRDAIVDALAPEMGSAIKRQIVLERESMVDALYPVIGNTIAKYFAEAIRSINQKVEQTFSVEGVQRKFRAKMQGVSEAELILKESVPFKIKAIFLIHNLSGLVMIDLQQSDLNSEAEPIDSDMLAGMLTAIRSFASECMSRSESNTELDAINYSGSKILLEVAGYCYLAVIIDGEPAPIFVAKIRDVFGRIIQVYGDRLKEFDGDPETIPSEAEIELQTLMEVDQSKSAKKSGKTLLWIGLATFALIFIPIGFYQYQFQRDRQLEAKVLEAFASTPELAVYRLNVAANGDRLKLTGKLPNQDLRDRALQVAIATTKSEKSEITTDKINNNIYAVNVPPEPILVANEVQRLTKALNYTQGVRISSQFQNGQITITGQIEQPSMIPKITQTFTKISGVTSVSNAAAIVIPKLSTRIYFSLGVTVLQPIELEKLVEVKAFLDMYPDYNLKILAKSDNLGDLATNFQLGMKRSQSVRDALLQRGVNAKRLHISGIIDSSIQQAPNQAARWVEFQPTLK